MFDYLDWRGDLSFENAPINAVDLLIFAWNGCRADSRREHWRS